MKRQFSHVETHRRFLKRRARLEQLPVAAADRQGSTLMIVIVLLGLLSILGVFLLAMIPWARAGGAFVGLIAGMATVGTVNFMFPAVAFLWHNVIGAVIVVVVGMAISVFDRSARLKPSRYEVSR